MADGAEPAADRSEDVSLDALISLAYKHLHALAEQLMRSERRGHTLQPTALINEAYLRLTEQDRCTPISRGQFWIAASRALRHVVVDYARKHNALKRGRDAAKLPLDTSMLSSRPDVDCTIVHEALNRLAQHHPRSAQIVELRFFGGLTIDEAAEALSISKRTVAREWRFARSWLHRDLAEEFSDGSGSRSSNPTDI